MSVWSIAGKGTFEDLGLANLSRSRVNQGIDQLSFDAPGTAIDKAPLFAYREQVSVLKDNEPFFTGICLTIPRSGTPADERISYEIAGPWYYLEKCIYQQSWRLWNPDISPPALADMYKSRVILCQNSAGKRITSGEQIRAAISHAISKGAPIALGTVIRP